MFTAARRYHSAYHVAGPPRPGSAVAAVGVRILADRSVPIDERCKAAFDADPALRTEFGKLSTFVAYQRAHEAGLVCIHRGGAVQRFSENRVGFVEWAARCRDFVTVRGYRINRRLREQIAWEAGGISNSPRHRPPSRSSGLPRLRPHGKVELMALGHITRTQGAPSPFQAFAEARPWCRPLADWRLPGQPRRLALMVALHSSVTVGSLSRTHRLPCCLWPVRGSAAPSYPDRGS